MLSPDMVLQARYQIIKQLGAGGMGTVYEAIDLRFNSQVALKETHFTEEALRKQFEREAHLLYKLRHPAIARVIDHFTEGSGQYLVMDFIEGDDLWETLLKRGSAFPVNDVIRWADQLLDALDYLHSQNPQIIHRDIKPQNLKLTTRNQIILLDFGLAKGFAGQVSRVTTSGSIFGYTPNYAPLEQIQGTGTNPRSDLYSLAATLYHLSTNVSPPDVLTRAGAVIGGRPDPLRPANEVNPLIHAALSDVLKKGMAIDSEQRYSSAAEMQRALQEANQAAPVSEAKTVIRQPRAFNIQPTKTVEETTAHEIPQTIPSPEPHRKEQEVPVTIASAATDSRKASTTAASQSNSFQLAADSFTSSTSEIPVKKPGRLKWIIGTVAAIAAVAFIAIAFSNRSNTPATNPQPANNGQGLIVSQGGGGQFQTINEAIKNTPAGGRILVRPGLYKESLVLDKRVEIIGDGPREQIIIESTNANGITMKTDSAIVKGLTVRTRNGRQVSAVEGTQFSFSNVSYYQGMDYPRPKARPIRKRPATTSPTTVIRRAPVVREKVEPPPTPTPTPTPAPAPTPAPTATQNTVGQGKTRMPAKPAAQGEMPATPAEPSNSGQYFAVEIAQGELVLEDCDISSEFLVAIEVRGKATQPTIRGCKIHDAINIGVHFTDYAAGRIVDSEISGIGGMGVLIENGANPTIQTCKINRNLIGIGVAEGAAATVRGSDLTNNEGGAWRIRGKALVNRDGNTE